MNELAIFDLDGTLIDLQIDTDAFERQRVFWASYLTSHGLPTTLKPLLPELRRISQTSAGSHLKADILKTFDDLEVACRYRSLGGIDAVLSAIKLQFRKLVLVTHNGSALWMRLAQENPWTRLIDTVITRDDMNFFKPDPRVCESVLLDFARKRGHDECWVIGNSEADRRLGVNLRREYTDLMVRTFMIQSDGTAATEGRDALDLDITSVDSLPDLLRQLCV